jgi:hypothetical protein
MSPSPAVTEKWMPVWPNQPAPSIIPPPEDGKWAKAQSGAVVWTPTPASPPGLVAAPDTGWHNIGAPGEPPFENGYATWGDPVYSPARFRKLPDGMVELDGLITGGSGATPLTVFTMPVGYRMTPQQSDGSQRISHYRGGGPAQGSNSFWIMAVGGAVQCAHTGTYGAWYVSLNQIRYYAGLS